jgi:hypothetical protein
MESKYAKLGRRSRVILLALAMAAIFTALSIMYMAFQAFVEADVEEASRRHIARLAIIAGALLVFALFCVGALILRYLAYGRLSRPISGEPTDYVNAWDLAGQRAAVPGEDELESMMGDDEDPDDRDDPPDESDR